MTDYYRINYREKDKRKGWRIAIIILIILLLLLSIGIWYIFTHLKSETHIKQAPGRTTKAVYTSNIKHYDEGDFTIDIQNIFVPQPRPVGPYKSFTFKSSNDQTNGQEIEIFQDVIPTGFDVNRMQVVESGGDRLNIVADVSDNCNKYTKGIVPAPNQHGVPAKWQGIEFLCDQSATERDVIGTSSADGINTVILTSPSKGTKHKFFFTFTNHTINPDYSPFIDALRSLRMQ